MVGCYVCLEVYGEKSCLQKIKDFFDEYNLTLEISERYDSEYYIEHKKRCKKLAGFKDDIFKGWIAFTSVKECRQVMEQLDRRDDIYIWVKMDL